MTPEGTNTLDLLERYDDLSATDVVNQDTSLDSDIMGLTLPSGPIDIVEVVVNKGKIVDDEDDDDLELIPRGRGNLPVSVATSAKANKGAKPALQPQSKPAPKPPAPKPPANTKPPKK